ncbi:MAG: hypothetical protein ACRD3C_15740 [Vicinamibacterales bacterium]
MALKRRQAGIKALDVQTVTLPVCQGRHSIPIAYPFDLAREELPSPTENPVKQRARGD